ncbi:MAG: hypothetical protein WBK47_01275, partial [Acetomicrobium sp.]
EGFFIEREIKDEFIYLNGKTRTNIKIVDDIKNEITDINFPGLQCDKQSCHDLKDKLARLARRYEGFVLSGSLPPGAPADFFADITSTLKSLGKFVALDTSDQGKTGDYRSRIWSYHT